MKEVNLFTRKRVVVITFLLILLWNGFFVSASCSLIIDGSIFKEDGLPIDGVNVFIWKDEMFLTQVETNLDGNFSLDVEPSFRYLIYIYADDEATPGLDYIPTSIETTPIDDETYRVVLEPAASLLFEGDIQFFALTEPQHKSTGLAGHQNADGKNDECAENLETVIHEKLGNQVVYRLDLLNFLFHIHTFR